MEKSSIMQSIIFCFCLVSLYPALSIGQEGCTDPQASNFDTLAVQNNGSCLYDPVNYVPYQIVNLPATLEEISGMIYWNGLFWGHNDSGNRPWLYAFDTLSGQVVKVVGLTGASNFDWEDMAQDDDHIYIGDFGNNANGNRTNLGVYKVSKALLLQQADSLFIPQNQYEFIQFSYPDQDDFTSTGGNNTRFDCETMFFHRSRLHLVTKNWVGNFSVHYSIPTSAGVYVAEKHDSLFTGGFLITGGDVGAEDEILLTAYNRSGACQFFLIYGFDSTILFFDRGNKRRINLPSALSIGQLEAVCFINGVRGAIGCERFRISAVDIPQNFRRFTSYQWIEDHYQQNAVSYAEKGMMRFNNETDSFEFFNGENWIALSDF
jgi:hypothetical protein